MMKRVCILFTMVLFVFGFTTLSEAGLVDQGLTIYDTDTGLIWLQQFNLPRTSGYDADGLMTWDASMTWADNLVYADHSDWRLPTISEMTHLYSVEGISTSSPGFFSMVKAIYWSSDEVSSTEAKYFKFSDGTSGTSLKSTEYYATAVAPEPISSILFVTGGATLGFRRFWKKRKTA